MEKYGVKDETLVNSLRDEEADLMQKMQAILASPQKTASDQRVLEQRLQVVRQKITDLDTTPEPAGATKEE